MRFLIAFILGGIAGLVLTPLGVPLFAVMVVAVLLGAVVALL